VVLLLVAERHLFILAAVFFKARLSIRGAGCILLHHSHAASDVLIGGPDDAAIDRFALAIVGHKAQTELSREEEESEPYGEEALHVCKVRACYVKMAKKFLSFLRNYKVRFLVIE
jgi:hypothetical protein